MCSDLFIKFCSPWIEFEESPAWEVRHEHRSGGQVDQRISTRSAVLDKDGWLQSWLPVNEDWLSLQNRVNLCHCWRVGFDLASILQWHINLNVVNTILSSQIFLITDPSGLEAIISSSSSPYRTWWTWKYGIFKNVIYHAPGETTVNDILQIINGSLVHWQSEECFQTAAVRCRQDEAVQDPYSKHYSRGISSRRVSVSGVALSYQSCEGEPGTFGQCAPGLQLFVNNLKIIIVELCWSKIVNLPSPLPWIIKQKLLLQERSWSVQTTKQCNQEDRSEQRIYQLAWGWVQRRPCSQYQK